MISLNQLVSSFQSYPKTKGTKDLNSTGGNVFRSESNIAWMLNVWAA